MKFGTLPRAALTSPVPVIARSLALLAIVTLLLWPAAAFPQALKPQPQVRDHMLVSTEWLARHLSDPTTVILHVAHERADYDAGHIPGALFLAVGQITTARNSLSNELPTVQDLKKVFESVGVGDRTQVVLYGERQGLWAARAWFTLDYLGHGDKAALLDGNIEKWRKENRRLTKDSLPAKPASFTPRVQPQLLVTLPVMQDLSWEALNTGSPTAMLVDARPPEEFRGEESAADTPRAGRIPGAVSLYWMTALESKENPRILPAAELRRLFDSAGIPQGRKVVSYCHSGVQAAYAYFMAKYLGFDAALYDGSFQEWSSAAGTQVATGK